MKEKTTRLKEFSRKEFEVIKRYLVFSDIIRRRILVSLWCNRILDDSPFSLRNLKELFQVDKPRLRYHLEVLERAGYIEKRPETVGKPYATYRITLAGCRALQELGLSEEKLTSRLYGLKRKALRQIKRAWVREKSAPALIAKEQQLEIRLVMVIVARIISPEDIYLFTSTYHPHQGFEGR